MQFKCGNSFLCIYFCSKSHHKCLSKRFREIYFSRRSANFRLLTSLYSYTFYYRLVINPTNTRVFRLKLPGGAGKIFPFNTMNKNFPPDLPFQGSIEEDYLSKNIKNLIYWISVQGQVKTTTVYNLIFLIVLYSLKNGNKQPSEMRN